MQVVIFVSSSNKNYYSQQLNSSKGLIVVNKGIESTVKPGELKEAGFNIKSAINIFNKNKVPQPMFATSQGNCRRATQKKWSSSMYQLPRIQTYEILMHTMLFIKCMSKKDNATTKKFSNCGENHTVNYSGCPAQKDMKVRLSNNIHARRIEMVNKPQIHFVEKTTEKSVLNSQNLMSNQLSYANVFKNNSDQFPQIQSNGDIDALTLNFTKCMTQFMLTIQNMIQYLIRAQNNVLQIFINKK